MLADKVSALAWEAYLAPIQEDLALLAFVSTLLPDCWQQEMHLMALHSMKQAVAEAEKVAAIHGAVGQEVALVRLLVLDSDTGNMLARPARDHRPCNRSSSALQEERPLGMLRPRVHSGDVRQHVRGGSKGDATPFQRLSSV